MKLNLGAADTIIPGFEPVDIRHGKPAYPLAYPDNSADVIRASHLLEHFSYNDTIKVILEWARVLKPGGWLKVAVPDFDWIVSHYQTPGDEAWNLEGFLLGGHMSIHDAHLAIFTEAKLRTILEMCGLVNLRKWVSEIPDCGSLPVSLNIEAQKPEGWKPPKDGTASGAISAPAGVATVSAVPAVASAPASTVDLGNLKIAACISVPRLGFQDHFLSCIEGFNGLRVKLRKVTGAYWGHCLELAMTEALREEKPELLLTLDYDTIFKADDLHSMIRVMLAHPEIDALAPVQSARSWASALFTIRGPDGKYVADLTSTDFRGDARKVSTAHFGLTLFRASKFDGLPHPWFQDIPASDGMWGEGCVDDDIGFWRLWERCGRNLHLANRVAVGHAELMVRWPGANMGAIYQDITDWSKNGKPKEAWHGCE